MKMGKSLGNTLEPKDLVEKFGADAVRYFFLREVEFGNDGDYSEERFINIVNAHLANTIGIFSPFSINMYLLLMCSKMGLPFAYFITWCSLCYRCFFMYTLLSHSLI
jgi:hypothetical protein